MERLKLKGRNTAEETTKDDIRKQTTLIIRKNGEYLVGRQLYDGPLRWSISPYDAYRTRNREKAQNLARLTGGIVLLFNPIIGEMKIL